MTLDDASVAELAAGDPGALLAGAAPVTIDEVQLVAVLEEFVLHSSKKVDLQPSFHLLLRYLHESGIFI
jgi:hypothetical protein